MCPPNASRATYIPNTRNSTTARTKIWRSHAQDIICSFLYSLHLRSVCTWTPAVTACRPPHWKIQYVFFSPSLKDERRLFLASYAAGKKPVLFKQHIFISSLSTSRLSPAFRPASAHSCVCASLFRSKAIVTYTTKMQKQTRCCLEPEWSLSLWCCCGIQRLNTLCLAAKVSRTSYDLSLMFLWLWILIFLSSCSTFIEKSAWHVNRSHIERLTIGIVD